ncbi:MAG: DUF177 domain-containing protein [Anaerolineae bacterium]|nr:DUF177 domain-containing protein [Anaerolineae bacterium]
MSHYPSDASPLSARVLKINVGFIISEGPGFSRQIELNIPQPITVAEDLTLHYLTGDVRLTRTSEGILVQGNLQTTVIEACSRCLREIEATFPVTLEELYAINQHHADTTVFSIQEDGILDLAPLIREETLLATPNQLLCEAACKGLCKSCGHNLNLGPCDCALEEVDPRWAALAEYQKRLMDG